MKREIGAYRKLFAAWILFALTPLWGLAADKPHVVIFLADDLGWKDVGYHGSVIKTPHIDALAEKGARLERFYTHPVCTQSRAALLTGRFPHRYNLHGPAVRPGSQRGLPKSETTLARLFKDAGYSTSVIGKWHLGSDSVDFLPHAHGFEYHYGSYVGQVDYFKHTYRGRPAWYRNDEIVLEDGYATDLIGKEAVSAVERLSEDEKLFLYVPFTAPHGPVQAPKALVAENQHIEDSRRRLFAAAVSSLDTAVGSVVAALEKKGILQNTFLIFLSDNGGSKKAGSSNLPLAGEKLSFQEGGIRVPAIFVWPGKIIGETVINAPVRLIDVYPTLLAAAGLSASTELDGVDLTGLLTGRQERIAEEMVLAITESGAVYLNGDWKFVEHFQSGELELYNLREDPGEQSNLASKEKGLAWKMRSALSKHVKELRG